jgi:hypothetical protein
MSWWVYLESTETDLEEVALLQCREQALHGEAFTTAASLGRALCIQRWTNISSWIEG